MSQNPGDFLSFDNIFHETDIAHGMIFKSKRSGLCHRFTLDIDPWYNYFEKFRGGEHWYMVRSNDFVLTINFEIKKRKPSISVS